MLSETLSAGRDQVAGHESFVPRDPGQRGHLFVANVAKQISFMQEPDGGLPRKPDGMTPEVDDGPEDVSVIIEIERF